MNRDIWEQLGEIGRAAPDETWEEYQAQVEATNSPCDKELSELRDLLAEALAAMLNLAPGIRKDRGGCFGDRQENCCCTACKIRRVMRPNAGIQRASPASGEAPLE